MFCEGTSDASMSTLALLCSVISIYLCTTETLRPFFKKQEKIVACLQNQKL